MIVRRLILLFFLLTFITGGLGLRLAQLQVIQANALQTEAKAFVHRHQIIETSRGAVLDNHDRPIAYDEPCYDLAIDYRAMNMDDRWLTRVARTRLDADGITARSQRLQQLPAYKLKVADAIDHIPAALEQVCKMPREEIMERYLTIRQRIAMLRQDRWSGSYDRQGGTDSLADDLDAGPDLKDERAAHTIIPAVTDDIAFYFEKHIDQYPGLVRVDAKRRTYPYHEVAAQVIGVMRSVSADALHANPFNRGDKLDDTPGNLKGYLPGDTMGGSGMERAAEDALRGSRGVRLMSLGDDTTETKMNDPVPGRAVRLSLDIELQKDIEESLMDPARKLRIGADGQEHPVALLVLNAENSKVLAMISLPSYDLDQYTQNVSDLLKDTVNAPLVNRCIQSGYPPGSTVKALVATAALTEQVVNATETITCNGFLIPGEPYHFRCDIFTSHNIGHGAMTLADSIERSCNIFFYNMGIRLGYNRILNWYRRFGFGAETGLELKEEQPGMLAKESQTIDPAYAKSESIFLGIGQGKIAVTPLQLANAYATLLRGGQSYQPSLLQDSAPVAGPSVEFSPETLAIVQHGLFEVVNGQHGTGRVVFRENAPVLKISIEGKTGSATATHKILVNGIPTPHQDSDAWFIGAVPADHPKYILCAIMELGGHGGLYASPMIKETVIQLERHGYLPPIDLQP